MVYYSASCSCCLNVPGKAACHTGSHVSHVRLIACTYELLHLILEEQQHAHPCSACILELGVVQACACAAAKCLSRVYATVLHMSLGLAFTKVVLCPGQSICSEQQSLLADQRGVSCRGPTLVSPRVMLSRSLIEFPKVLKVSGSLGAAKFHTRTEQASLVT